MTVKYIPLESKSGFKSPGFLVNPNGRIQATELVLTEPLDVPNLTLNGVELISGIDSTVSLSDGITHSYLEKLGTLQYLNIDGDFTVSQSSTNYISVINGEIRITNPTLITTQIYENINQTLIGVDNNTIAGTGAVFTVTRTDGSYSVLISSPGSNFVNGDSIVIPGTFLGGENITNDLTITITATDPLNSNGIFTVSASGTAVSESHGSMNNVDIGLSTPARGKFINIESTGDLTVSGNATISGSSQFNSVRVNTAPTEVYHATRKDYVDSKISAFSIAFGG